MNRAYDKLFTYMTWCGVRCIDMTQEQEEHMQYEVEEQLMIKHSVFPQDPPCEKEKMIYRKLQGTDGTGWIDEAKKLGLIRKRTRAEKAQHDSDISKWMSLDVVDKEGKFFANT